MIHLFLFKLNRIFWFGLVTLIFTVLMSLFSPEVTQIKFLLSALGVGFVLGFFEEVAAGNWLRKQIVPLQFLIRLIVVNIAVLSATFIIAIIDVDTQNVDLIEFVLHSNYIKIIYKFFIVSVVVIVYFQMESLIGRKMFRNYLFGKYSKPREDERIFMFIDMKDSTTIAEKLTHEKFNNLVNDCIYEMSVPAIKTDAEILKYIGDEVIFTWGMKSGLKKNNCVRIYDLITKRLKQKEKYFLKEYGFMPFFKAGVHGGLCMSAQIGHIKKAIDYSGDTLNTAARIQSVCNDYNAELLMSEELFSQLQDPSAIKSEKIGSIELKGKASAVDLRKILF